MRLSVKEQQFLKELFLLWVQQGFIPLRNKAVINSLAKKFGIEKEYLEHYEIKSKS